MKTLSGSLAALAIVAARDGQWLDVARLLTQAAVAPDADQFLECELTDNFEANCLVNSVSSASSMADSVTALSAALALTAEEERAESLYDDEVVSLNTSEDDSADDVEDEEDLDDEDDVTVVDSESSSLIRLRLD
ncbi:hypothetical protein pEaSNUABM14_00145 [Erwinia phage pEa_SNUABM_14]|uniref:Uncharacterized protein n=1 Tax=Erwinia phage pEa_SNUABM_7 TaxID=2866695 RepID=A0AAE7WSZ9_9CAUD|nr:hypothetical protein MPK74_gp146 [Erwinia phage pEa_SNUABM_7]QYW03105.1 hypothetical protein pEaSNUABM13_00146 [Erwinia phage pEa_SNUABM_13]QYW03446.1 hypothetical protein pEaSNUABM34_00144 [Erwinia phage pEa_SNUABM_34]QYW03788.1 hypothetical protein pEaSNUABM45_00145 [Erwinia phage pEa_SNUABM_45]QYW04129.1 hypothetical protein pEaSNUABM46_00145 [Erwinia phage pEa_SNUABM_46]QYW04470.1 hypothetical protein pEaSNUABM14_00145 [Erwinia phage pEa_SNUABM_14]QYW05159.1 hypothetical protein pEaSNU